MKLSVTLSNDIKKKSTRFYVFVNMIMKLSVTLLNNKKKSTRFYVFVNMIMKLSVILFNDKKEIMSN